MRRALVALVFVAGAATAFAQGGRYGMPILPNPKYDGQFTFVRLRYGPETRVVSQNIPWSHDYPSGERNFMKSLDEVSYLGPKTAETSILGLDDPELFKHPIAYMAEAGFWAPTEAEAASFRAYLLKGGFVIFDDFRGQDWWNLEEQMKRVLPEHRFIELDVTHPVFHSFFDIKDLGFLTSYNASSSSTGRPTYWGIFEDNDPKKRLIAIANRDNDLGEYWEYSDTGMDPIDFSNEAYKYGVNYILYGLMQ